MIGTDDVFVGRKPKQHHAHERMMRHEAIKELAMNEGYQGAEVA